MGLGTTSVQASEGKVTVLKGSADKKTEALPWHGLSVSDPIGQGDRVKTKKKSLAEVQLPGHQTIRLGPRTTVDFTTVFADGEKTISQLDLEEGDLWAEVEKLDEDSIFNVDDHLAHASVRGTIFSYHADKASTVLNVYRGAVEMSKQTAAVEASHQVDAPHEVSGPKEVAGPREVSMHAWLQVIKAMQQITIYRNGKWEVNDITDKEALTRKWEQWNRQLGAVTNQSGAGLKIPKHD